nr:unnamed protein product [Callosobruchus chinensis]
MWKVLCAGSAGRQLKLRNTSSSIVLPCAEEEARIRKLSRRREDRIKRLEALNQLKKAEKRYDEVKDENLTLKQITQLKAGNASFKEDLNNAVAEAKKAKGNFRERLAQLVVENKKLQSELSNALMGKTMAKGIG